MADNPITVPLPQDLPQNWTYGQTIGPQGTDVGLTKQHGYNYLMQQVNAAQQAAQELGEAFSDLYGEGDIVPVTGGGTEAKDVQNALNNLGAGVRPNFLDNAYFVGGGAEFGVFPVKYKEMSEIISTPGYFIPRWKLISGSVKVTADGLFLNGTISQIIPASIGTACSAVAVTASEIIEAEYDNESRIFTISASEKTIIFAKLETGENQTAAYQKNGQVIFLAQNIPNYALTLSKCQSYSVLFGSTGAYSPIGMGQARSDQDLVVVIPTPETMRIAPVAKISGYITARNQNIYVQMTSVVVEGVGPGTVLVSFQAENLIPGAAYDVFCTPGNFLELNAEP